MEFVKRFIRREPVLVRAVLAAGLSFAIARLHLDPAVKGTALVVIDGALLTWARTKVQPVK